MALPAPFQNAQLPLPDAEAYADEPREYARALMQSKDELDKEIAALEDVLRSHGASAETSLVDPEGYPRGDIDIYAIRHARSALVRLKNDRVEVMRRLAGALENAFAPDPNASEPAGPTAAKAAVNGHRDADIADAPETWPERAIARVNSVAPGSPAADAHLQAGDVIYSFSGVTFRTDGGMAAIGPVVARSEGQPLTLLVLRGSERTMLRLTPRSGWGGRGLLGCHILPV